MGLGKLKATRAVATIVVGGALVASGCKTDREITRPEPEPITEERLAAALLTEDDVPSPYTPVEDGTDPVGPEVVPEHECDDALGELDPEETATVSFTGRGLDTTLTNTISWYPGRGGSVADRYADLFSDCAQVVVSDEGLSFKTASLDFGVLSDDTLPVRFTIEHDDGTIDERNLIVIRSGDLVSVIRLDGPRPSDLVVLDAVTRVAIGYLGLLDQDT